MSNFNQPTGKTAEYIAAQTAYTDGIFDDLLDTQNSIIDDMNVHSDELSDRLVELEVQAIIDGEGQEGEFDDLFELGDGIDFQLDDTDLSFDDLFEV